MKLEDGRGFACGGRGRFRTEVLGVDAGAAYAGKPQIVTLDVGCNNGGAGAQFGLRCSGVEFAQGFSPIIIEVGRTWIAASVALKFGEGEVNEGHFKNI